MTDLKPIQPGDARPAGSRDHAQGGFPLSSLENLIHDCENQPEWRPRADLNVAYYDSKQLTAKQRWGLKREGLEERCTNLISGIINSLLGQEAKSRSDVKVEADDDDFADVSDVLSMRLKEAQRESYADMAVSNAYGSQVKAGIGWVEVSRAQDPLDYPYRVLDVHRNEMWYDWRAKHIGLHDARWLVRKRWQDLDEVVAAMPEHRRVLMHCCNSWTGFLLDDNSDEAVLRSYDDERRFAVRRSEWVDGPRRRIKLYEVWYRVPAHVVVLHLPGGRRVRYDERNPLHVEAVSRGVVPLSKAVTRQVRMALFAGPHRLLDVGTEKRHFPYIPFFAFRDDEDNSPYGLIDGMRSPQDEYNERRLRLQWMLKARQITIEDDALSTDYNTIADIVETAMRPDMVAVLNSKRSNQGGPGIKIGNDLTVQREQFEVMQDAKQLIQDVPRVYGTQLGNAPTGVTAGNAISSLIEQGLVSQGELNDNYRYSRRMVFESLTDLIVEDLSSENLQVMLGSGSTRRAVVLNAWDNGRPVNRVKDAPVRVGLSDVPNSPAFKLQQQQQIATIIGALAGVPAAVQVLTPAFIESTTLPDRQQIADDIRRITGLPAAGDREGVRQQQAMAQEQAQRQAEVADKAAQLELADKAAEVEVKQAKAGLDQVRAAQVVHQIQSASNEDQLISDALAEAG